MPSPTQQLLSRTIYATDGITTDWNFSFSGGYLNQAHVQAYTESPTGVRTDLTINVSQLIGPYQLRISPALAIGDILVIYRATPRDLPMVDFTDGSGLSETALDVTAKQSVFLAAEIADETGLAGVAAAAGYAQAAEQQAYLASVSAIDALAFKTDAEAAALSATTSLDSFDDRYLGSKASNPTLDNGGNALLVGAMYWNSATSELRFWSGSAWQTVNLSATTYAIKGPLAASGITGAAEAGANTSITSLGTVTTVTQASTDNSTKIATTAFANSIAVGVGQTWQNVTTSRAAATTYTNSTGKPITLAVSTSNLGSTGSTGLQLTCSGVLVLSNVGLNGIGPGNLSYSATLIIPPGATYSVALISATISQWFELR